MTRLTRHLLQELDLRGRVTPVELEVREANEDGSIPFKGHAAVFNRWATIFGMFQERFMPGAFAKTVQEADVRMLINHNPTFVLARSKAGNLRLSEDRKGLLAEADMTPTSYAQDLALSLERGDVSQMSIGFRVIRDDWDESGKMPKRTIHEAQLFDVSAVTFPAYEGTDAALRSMEYDAMLQALGLDEVEAEDRNTLLMQLTSGDVAPEFVPILRSAQDRLASLLPPAGSTPPEPAQTEEPASRHSGNRQLFERRLRMLGQKHGLPMPAGGGAQ